MDSIHEETIMFVALVALAGFVLWLLFRRYQVISQARLQRVETFNKLIEKFGTTQEFIEFVNSEQGKRFLEDPLPQQMHPRKTVLRFIQTGVILAAVCVAFLIKWMQLETFLTTQTPPDINWINEAMDYEYWTWLSGAVSVGMIVLAIVTNFFTKKWRVDSSSPANN
ncbi:MAG TPA: hypothetical protein VGR15_04315 [Bacteroidota bacterium]|jgi:hypothetical protein|nr:hypothetical protein [Bacteroidota bacterium]